MTMHILEDLEQGSDAWHDQRRGIVTASVVGRLVTTNPPDATSVPCSVCGVAIGPCLSVARKKATLLKTVHTARTAAAAELPPTIKPASNDESRGLTTLLAAERITGRTESTYQNADMFRGVLCEPIARDLYSGLYHQAVEVGFMVRREDDWTLGFSPDGLVGDDGLIEVKAPRAKGQVATILADEVPAYHIPQCQAGLLVSGRKWLDFVSYSSGLPLFVKRIHPDQRWFDAITAACIQFEGNVTAMCAKYEAQIVGMPKTERIDFDLELVV